MSQMTPRTSASRSIQARGRDLAGDHRDARLDQRFAGDARARVVREHGVEHGVGDLVGDLVGMSFGNRFGGEQVVAGHRKIIRHRRQWRFPAGAPRCPSRRELANAIRALSMDAVQRANSGHPGMPMGMADIAEVLWRDFLKHNPGNPRWADRDRFVLSNGHGSMLLYSRAAPDRLSARARRNAPISGSSARAPPGHPEHEIGIGIETTTGPLGQGLANAVGMALAEKKLAAAFNRPGHEIVDHHTWVFLGDGCLMEGISHEACSLAGTWGLGKLIAFYDDNGISIDGEVARLVHRRHAEALRGLRLAGDPRRRRPRPGGGRARDPQGEAREVEADADLLQDDHRLRRAEQAGQGGTPRRGARRRRSRARAQDARLAVRALRRARTRSARPGMRARRASARRAAGAAASRPTQQAHPELAAEFQRRSEARCRRTSTRWIAEGAAAAQAAAQPVATRQSSQAVLERARPALPELLGGSADLTGSNNTTHQGVAAVSRPRRRTATICTTACASSAWARS